MIDEHWVSITGSGPGTLKVKVGPMQEIPPCLWESFTHLISPFVCFNWISHMSLWLPGLCSASRNGILIANMSQLK